MIVVLLFVVDVCVLGHHDVFTDISLLFSDISLWLFAAPLCSDDRVRPPYLTSLKMLMCHIPYQRLLLGFVFSALAFQVEFELHSSEHKANNPCMIVFAYLHLVFLFLNVFFFFFVVAFRSRACIGYLTVLYLFYLRCPWVILHSFAVMQPGWEPISSTSCWLYW